MKTNALSVFIEAKRFPPAINQHRYSLMRAEADAIVKQKLKILNCNNLSKAAQSSAEPGMAATPAQEVYELEANEISVCSSLILPEIKSISPFNPFDEPIPSSVSPVAPSGSSVSTPLPSPRPGTNFLPYIARTAPFDPYKENYVAHPAGKYIAHRYTGKRCVSYATPSGLALPTTPTFFDETLSLSNAPSPTIPSLRTPRQAASKPSVSYTPPGSPLRLNPGPPRPMRPTTTDFTSRPDLSHSLPIRSSRTSRVQINPPKTNKPLPPVPRGSHKIRPSTSTSQHRNNPLQQFEHPRSTNRVSHAMTPLNHRANWQQENSSSHHRVVSRSYSDELDTRPVTAGDLLKSDLKEVGRRFTSKFL